MRRCCLLVLCSLFATPALAQGATAAPSAPTQRTIHLGPDSTIQYTAEPGDERSSGTLSVLPMARLPSGERGAAAEEVKAQEKEAAPLRRQSQACGDPRGKLAVRLLQLRGLDVDEVSAPWIWQRLAFFGESLPLAALQSDLFARSLAIELAHCEAAAAR